MNKSYDQRIEEERKETRRSWLALLLISGLFSICNMQIVLIGLEMQNEWFIVPLMVILAVGFVLMMGGMIYWLGASHEQKLERSKEVSERLQPDLPVVEEERVPKKKLLWLISIILLLLTLYWFLFKYIVGFWERFWPDGPFMLRPIIVLSIFSSMLSLMWLVLKWLLPQKEESKLVPWKRTLFVMAQFWYPTFLMVFLYVGLPWLIKTYDLPSVIAILGFFLSNIVLPLLLFSPFPILQWWIWRAVKKGDYEQAFSRLRLVEEFQSKDRKLLRLEGRLFFLAGRNEEAQKLFYQALRDGDQLTKSLDSHILNDLGRVLLGQGRYEEATRALEGSIDIKASQVLGYSRLAEVYLYQGIKLKEARKLTEQALQNHDASLLLRFYGKEALIETLAIHAWVLAELGLHHEAGEALERAFAVASRNHKPLLAALHLRAGYVSLRRDDHHQAKQHFTRGQELDPKGHYGRLAGAALAKM